MLADQAAGQDADVLGEEAEEELDQEVGGLVGVLAAGLEGGRDLAEPGGGFLGDVVDRAPWLEHLRLGEEEAEDGEIRRLVDPAERDIVVDDLGPVR